MGVVFNLLIDGFGTYVGTHEAIAMLEGRFATVSAAPLSQTCICRDLSSLGLLRSSIHFPHLLDPIGKRASEATPPPDVLAGEGSYRTWECSNDP